MVVLNSLLLIYLAFICLILLGLSYFLSLGMFCVYLTVNIVMSFYSIDAGIGFDLVNLKQSAYSVSGWFELLYFSLFHDLYNLQYFLYAGAFMYILLMLATKNSLLAFFLAAMISLSPFFLLFLPAFIGVLIISIGISLIWKPLIFAVTWPFCLVRFSLKKIISKWSFNHGV